MEYLLEKGSNINQSGGAERWSPLCLAAISCSEDVVVSLLSLGADKNTPDIKGVSCADSVYQITMSLKKILDNTMVGRKQDLNEMDVLFNRVTWYLFSWKGIFLHYATLQIDQGSS